MFWKCGLWRRWKLDATQVHPPDVPVVTCVRVSYVVAAVQPWLTALDRHIDRTTSAHSNKSRHATAWRFAHLINILELHGARVHAAGLISTQSSRTRLKSPLRLSSCSCSHWSALQMFTEVQTTCMPMTLRTRLTFPETHSQRGHGQKAMPTLRRGLRPICCSVSLGFAI